MAPGRPGHCKMAHLGLGRFGLSGGDPERDSADNIQRVAHYPAEGCLRNANAAGEELAPQVTLEPSCDRS